MNSACAALLLALSAAQLLGAAHSQTCDSLNVSSCPSGKACVPKSAKVTSGNCEFSYPGIKYLHVVNSCHLDIGFANSSLQIVNEYFDHHIPMAVSVGEELRAGGVPFYTDSKLNFMFQSWIVDLYLDCPGGMGLHCPSKVQINAALAAVARNHITWQAYPHDAQLEVISPALIKAGLFHTFALDDRFNQTRKRTLSQRDVPGLTRGSIPLLRSMNISTVTVGQNSGASIPEIPSCFVWRDRASNTSLVYILTNGYGWFGQQVCESVMPYMEHALVYNFNGDNSGPSSAAAYSNLWRILAIKYPNATGNIYASTFDNYTQHLNAPAVRSKLPVVESEIGVSG